MRLEDLGYDDYFKTSRKSLGLDSYAVARVIAEHKEAYKVKNEKTESIATVTGKLMYAATTEEDYPCVGDWVAIAETDSRQAKIHMILPRKTVLKRKAPGKFDTQTIASNIDIALIVQSPDRDYNLNRFERYMTIVNAGGIKPVIILNKTDLVSKSELELKTGELYKRFSDVDVLTTSIYTENGTKRLTSYLKKGLTYCFVGSSGVGKSSLINRLLGEDLIKTAPISQATNRGKHITTHRELFILKTGGMLIDNPGMREIGILESENGMEYVFTEFFALSEKCRFADCTHVHEPGCAVLEALKSGELDKNKYKNYRKMMKENEFYKATRLERRKKERKFGKMVKQVMKHKKKHKP